MKTDNHTTSNPGQSGECAAQTALFNGQRVDTTAVYHPGDLYERIGKIEDFMPNGGIAVRYESRVAGHHSTVADFTANERKRIVVL